MSEDYVALLRGLCHGKGLCYNIETFGCQQNVHDGEILGGVLDECGLKSAPQRSADVIIFNTCCIRESAEEKIIGRIGALKALKTERPSLVIGIGGCMTAQKDVSATIMKKFPFVSFVFGANAFGSLPELVFRAINGQRSPLDGAAADISEQLPVIRREPFRADVSVMYGCDNFCSYCIVPYVRGRERSRTPDAVVSEAAAAVSSGAREITLLGQNVNSYGKGLMPETDFASLLHLVCRIPGDFRLRFMTSHPKDASPELFEAMAAENKVCRHLHLPLQSGSDRILAAMNRRYDTAGYLKKVASARKLMPELTVTSDIIVGFPGETDEDFAATLDICREVGFDSLFTFIYSPRSGTKAASMDCRVPDEVAHERFVRLNELQNAVSVRKNRALVGKKLRVLVTGASETVPELLAGRTEGNRLVHFAGGPELTGKLTDVEVTAAKTWSLEGKLL